MSEEALAGTRTGWLSLYSVKGPGELAADLEVRMADPAKRAQLLDLIRSVEQERTLLGVSSHFVVVATK